MKPYVLITGASQGLGKAIALECAQRQMNLLLVALPNSGLEKLSVFIKDNFKVEVVYLELDLSVTKSSYEISNFIKASQLQIQYLVNNAGVLSRGMFDELSDQYILRQIEVNVITPTLLTKLLLDNLKNNTPAAILNISSMASFFAIPRKQVYGATKAYLTSFSKSLNKELVNKDISVTTICPGGLNTTTGLCYQNRILGWIPRKAVLNPEEAAKIAINSMLLKKKIVVPGFINQCLMVLDKLLPEFLKDKLTQREFNKFQKVASI